MMFVAIFAVLVAAEYFAPRRPSGAAPQARWFTNLSVLTINTLVARAVVPAGAVGVALMADERSLGLLHMIDAPFVLKVVLAFIALDFAIYLQHVLFHALPMLWRLHRVHHADLDFDVTTGLRFHPIEILLSLLIKTAAILVIGPPVIAVLLFEIMLNASAMFSHSNICLPGKVDRVLRLLLVTPDMHRVHHSIAATETNSNFGFNLPWWDRLFKTYCAQPAAGHEGMTIGIPQFRSPEELRLGRVLAQPFRNEYPDVRSTFSPKSGHAG